MSTELDILQAGPEYYAFRTGVVRRISLLGPGLAPARGETIRAEKAEGETPRLIFPGGPGAYLLLAQDGDCAAQLIVDRVLLIKFVPRAVVPVGIAMERICGTTFVEGLAEWDDGSALVLRLGPLCETVVQGRKHGVAPTE